MKKKFSSLILVFVLILSSFNVAFGTEANDTKTITIIHTNDTHARIVGTDSEIGFAKISTIIQETKAKNPNTLVLDAGDTLHGMPIVNISKGENAIRILEAAGYDFMSPGNHDFNYGQERLLELKDMTSVKMLSANLFNDKGKSLFTPYEIVEIDGIKVGIFGLTTPETAYKTSPDNVIGIDFKDPVEVSEEIVKELKEKADIIIALAHIGLDESSVITTRDIAEKVDGIDVIIDGHSHTTLESGLVVNDILIAQTGNYAQGLGFVNIEIKDGKIVSKTAELLTAEAAAEIIPDAEIADMLDKIIEQNKSVFEEVVAKTDIDLDGARENVRTKETNLGNLSADAVRAASGADIGFVNGGNIRISIPIGDITYGMVAELFPFGNTVQVKKITGKDLLEVLEISVSGYPATQGGFLQVSGMTFEFDPSLEIGSRVSNVVVGGEPLDLKGEYTVAINDFLGIGGDGYEVFKDYPIYAEVGTYEEVFADYLNTNGTKGSDVTGRIKVIETAQEEPVIEEPDAPTAKEISYIVVSGDVLWKIAAKYNTTWQELAEYNNIKNPHLIYPGQVIKILVEEVKPAA